MALPRAAATTSGAGSPPRTCPDPHKRQNWAGSPTAQQLATPPMISPSAPHPICRPRARRGRPRALLIYFRTRPDGPSLSLQLYTTRTRIPPIEKLSIVYYIV